MSRAADQRVVYALKNGKLVPKSEVLGRVAGASAPVAVERPVLGIATDEAKRRGRPPKVVETEVAETEVAEAEVSETEDDVSEFKIEE